MDGGGHGDLLGGGGVVALYRLRRELQLKAPDLGEEDYDRCRLHLHGPASSLQVAKGFAVAVEPDGAVRLMDGSDCL